MGFGLRHVEKLTGPKLGKRQPGREPAGSVDSALGAMRQEVRVLLGVAGRKITRKHRGNAECFCSLFRLMPLLSHSFVHPVGSFSSSYVPGAA